MVPPKLWRYIDRVFEKKINEYTKPNQYIPKHKHNHIGGNDSSSTFEIKTVYVEEKCTFSNQINL